jgi:hypothetical protein
MNTTSQPDHGFQKDFDGLQEHSDERVQDRKKEGSDCG